MALLLIRRLPLKLSAKKKGLMTQRHQNLECLPPSGGPGVGILGQGWPVGLCGS